MGLGAAICLRGGLARIGLSGGLVDLRGRGVGD